MQSLYLSCAELRLTNDYIPGNDIPREEPAGTMGTFDPRSSAEHGGQGACHVLQMT